MISVKIKFKKLVIIILSYFYQILTQKTYCTFGVTVCLSVTYLYPTSKWVVRKKTIKYGQNDRDKGKVSGKDFIYMIKVCVCIS